MPLPKLYDYVLSAECYTARLMLALLGITYEAQAVDMYPGREHEGEELRRLSPDGAMPIFEDSDTVAAGVGPALVRIAEAHDPSGRWLPRDGRGLVISWLDFATRELSVLERAREVAVMGRSGDLAALTRDGWRALRVLEDRIIDRCIDGSDWMVRRTPSIADIACFPHAALAHDSGIGLEDFPAIALWMRRIRQLPGFISMPGIPDYF